MTVLAADRETSRKEPGYKSLLMGTDIIYKGGFVTTDASGLALAGQATAGHKFAGVAYEKVDDSAGAGTKWVRVYTRGLFLLVATSITQVMVGQMMYLTDDQTFDDVPASIAIPCGVLVEYISATSGWIDIGPAVALGQRVQHEMSNELDFVTKTDDYTCTAKDSGTRFAIATDAKTFTLPATVRGLVYEFWNTGAAGNNIITISPNAADGIAAPSLTNADDKDLINTKATADYGDHVRLVGDGGAGWIVTHLEGVWAKEA
jgi:hypothetical protein